MLDKAGPADGGQVVVGADEDLAVLAEAWGVMPLPPYITHADDAPDETRYQTIFARHPGAVAAPTAALHFDQTVLDETQRLESVIEKNQADHNAVGHWGVPTCAFEGEPFFGQDRLDVLLWRLKQHGLSRRS